MHKEQVQGQEGGGGGGRKLQLSKQMFDERLSP